MSKKYQKINALTQVAEFHKTFKAPVLDTAAIPDKARTNLRVSLLQEELDELKEAIDEESIVGIADALCDLQYVLSGAILEFGLGNLFAALFDEVHRSNMSKACINELQAMETQQFYADKDGIETTREQQEDGTWIVYRKPDYKTLKSVYYSPADLKEILETPAFKTGHRHLLDDLDQLENAALPLMEYMATNHDPHTTAMVTANRAELTQSIRAIVNNKFIE